MKKRELLQGICAASVVLMTVACQPTTVPSTTPSPSAVPTATPTSNPAEEPVINPQPTTSASPSPAASVPPAVVEGSSNAVIDAPANAPVVALSEIRSIVVSSSRFLNEGAGSTTQLKVSLKDAAGNAVRVEDVKLIFESLNPTRFSVSADGTVTALVDFGTGRIQVTEPTSGLSASLDMSVSSGVLSGGGGGGGGGGGSTTSPTPTPSPSPSSTLGLSLSYAGLGLDVFRVNSTTEGAQENAKVAMDSAGNYVVIWESMPAITGETADELCGSDVCFNYVSEENRLSGADGDGSGIFGQRFRADGVPLGPEFQVNSFTRDAIVDTETLGDGDGVTYFELNGQDTPDVAMNASGQFVVVWESDEQDGDRNGIFAQRYNAAGQPVGGEFQVNTIATGEQDNPSVAIRNDGSFVVAWEHEDESDTVVHYRAFTAAGNPVSNDQVINANDTSEVHVAASSTGEVTIAWEDRGFNISTPDPNAQLISFQRLNSSSALVGTQGSVVAMGEAYSFDLAYLANGQLVFGWEFDGSAYFNLYNSSNAALLSPAQKASTDSDGNVSGVSVSSNGSDRFALSWDSNALTPDNSVYARAYSYSNAVLTPGNEMRINKELGNTETGLDNDRDDAHIAMDINGNLVIVWEADLDHPEDPVFGVFGKLLTNNGDVK